MVGGDEFAMYQDYGAENTSVRRSGSTESHGAVRRASRENRLGARGVTGRE